MSEKLISIVVAYDQNRGIGAANDLLWQRDLPSDLKHFRELTTGGSIIMGRNTFESIGRALPNRQNIVVTHRPLEAEGVAVAADLQAACSVATEPVFIIGGGSIYQQALPEVERVYATEVLADFPQASVFFPTLDGNWHEISREHHEASDTDKYPLDFVIYERN